MRLSGIPRASKKQARGGARETLLDPELAHSVLALHAEDGTYHGFTVFGPKAGHARIHLVAIDACAALLRSDLIRYRTLLVGCAVRLRLVATVATDLVALGFALAPRSRDFIAGSA